MSKVLVYERGEGRTCICIPVPWTRLVRSVVLPNGDEVVSSPPVPIERPAKVFAIDNLAIEWAETEGEFIERVRLKDVPVRLDPPQQTTIDGAPMMRAFASRAEATANGWTFVDIQVLVADEADVPKDRTFRNAWRPNMQVDMPKAREIWRERMRQVRKPKLQALDAEYLRADEASDLQRKQQIAQQKQRLRDVTVDPGIESAATPDALKAVWPDILK